MKPLCIADFDAYYRELHGEHQEPFPWQRRLMRRVAEQGQWPELLELPTGTGKTTALDIAVFAQALDAERPPADRRAPRRTVLVVDRRTVVDQAHERALKIMRRLAAAGASGGSRLPVLSTIAERLRLLAGEGSSLSQEASPLGVHLLRGGMPRDDDWARSPTQPLIAVSTVDQVGSRLLFRGYGLSSRMQPVHAGLLANDVLFLLDEVHLARPFRDLLMAIQERYRGMSRLGLPDRWQLVQMSATAGPRPASTFGLDAEDRAHPVLSRRLGAKKPTSLCLVPASGAEDKCKRALARAMAEEATRRFRGGTAIGIVVNRVQTARLVFEELAKPVESQGGTLHLVTGRMRPVDREELERQLKQEVGSDRDRSQTALRVVVATQCIEAGADFDFDVLLTECASLDALRQRFGRLDRLGTGAASDESRAQSGVPQNLPVASQADVQGVGDSELSVTKQEDPSAAPQLGKKSKKGGAGRPADSSSGGTDWGVSAVVFGREDQVGEKASEDPVYGSALKATWEYLNGLGTVDFGLEQLVLPSDEAITLLLAPARQGPLLLPAHLDAWVQTSPAPYADPEPALWLHGSEEREPEVTLVWRADLTEEELRRALGDAKGEPQGGGSDGPSETETRGALAPEEPPTSLEEVAPGWLAPRLEACPPRSSEALAVPLGACRAWLRREAASDVTDAGALPAAANERRKFGMGRPAIVWRGERPTVVMPSRVSPGDAVVVPSSYGGLVNGTWAPDAADAGVSGGVADVGDRAQLVQRGRVQVRLHPQVIRAMLVEPDSALTPLAELRDAGDPDFEPIEAAREYLRALPGATLKPWARALRKALTDAPQRELRLVDLSGATAGSDGRNGLESGFILMRSKPLSRGALRALLADAVSGAALGCEFTAGEAALISATGNGDESSLSGVEVTLDAHVGGVGALARGHAAACGLPEALCHALELAGEWHDLGKADPRFQRWLHNGSAFKASVAKALIAKSSLPAQDPVARRQARERAGYPEGARHELSSLALLSAHPRFANLAGEHWELVQYLVGAHHGWCRPFAPFVEDPEPVEISIDCDGTQVAVSSAHGLERLDAGVPERFWRLVRRYGWFGLAWLEALFRLADHRWSEAEVVLALAEKEGREHAA